MSDGMTRFGQVEFDAVRGRLSVAGRLVDIDRPSVAILALLLADAGKDVDKDRLLEAGWPGRVVHENSLAKAISRLRQALGDDGRALETVHGYGYRLEVEPEVAGAPGLPKQATPARPRSRFVAVGIAAVALVLIISLGLFAGQSQERLIRGEPADAVGRVLWVDDNPDNNAAERQYLERRKIAVYQVKTSDEALALLAMYKYNVVVSDMNRHGKPLDGLTLVREMRRRNDGTPFYLYTYVPSKAQHKLVTDAGGQGAAVKPEELYAAILPLFRKGQPK